MKGNIRSLSKELNDSHDSDEKRTKSTTDHVPEKLHIKPYILGSQDSRVVFGNYFILKNRYVVCLC
jgi:hypothetical protein